MSSTEMAQSAAMIDSSWAIPEYFNTSFATLYPFEDQGGEELTTLHSVILAAILPKSKETKKVSVLDFGSSTSKTELPRVHRKDAPKEPRSWKDLADHPFGEQFKADAELEIKNLESRDY